MAVEASVSQDLTQVQVWLRDRAPDFFEALREYGSPAWGFQQDDPRYNFWNHGEFTGEDLAADASVILKQALERKFPDLPVRVVSTPVLMINYSRATKDSEPFKIKDHAWLRVGQGMEQIFVDGTPGQVDPSLVGQILSGDLDHEASYLGWDPTHPPVDFTEVAETHFRNNLRTRIDIDKKLAALIQSLTD